MCEYLEIGSFQVSGATDVVMFRGNSWLFYEFFTKLLCRTLKGLRSSPKGKRLEINALWLVCVITSCLEHVNLRVYSHRASATCTCQQHFQRYHLLIAYYRPQTKLLEGNVFTPVCQSFCSQREGSSWQRPWTETPRTETPSTETPGQRPTPLGRDTSSMVKSGRYASLYISQYILVRRLKLIWRFNVVAALMLTLNVNGPCALFSFYHDLSFLRAFFIIIGGSLESP